MAIHIPDPATVINTRLDKLRQRIEREIISVEVELENAAGAITAYLDQCHDSGIRPTTACVMGLFTMTMDLRQK